MVKQVGFADDLDQVPSGDSFANYGFDDEDDETKPAPRSSSAAAIAMGASSDDSANLDETLHLEDAFQNSVTKHSFRDVDDILAGDHSVGSDSTNSAIIQQHRATNEGPGIDQTVATIETKAVRLLRISIWLGLLITTTTVCVLVYFIATAIEEQNFEEHFEDMAVQIIRGVHANLYRHLQVADLMATVFTSVALETQQVWPLVTFQNYEAISTAARTLVGAPFMGVYPQVSQDLRTTYEQYTQQPPNVEWVNASIDYQEAFQQAHGRSTVIVTDNRKLLTQFDISFDAPKSFEANSAVDEDAIMTRQGTPSNSNNATTSTPVSITTTDLPNFWNGIYGTNPQIFRMAKEGETTDEQHNYNGNFYVNEAVNASGPFYPVWQSSPVTGYMEDSIFKGINYNVLDLPQFQDPFDIVQSQREAVLATAAVGKEVPITNPSSGNNRNNNLLSAPVASLLYPVFDALLTASNIEVAGVMETEIEFQHFFSYILPPDHNSNNDANTLLAVISNCQGTYSFRVNSESAVYLGPLDLHNAEFDDKRSTTLLSDMNSTSNTGTVYNGVPLNTKYCPWELNVYATEEMEGAFLTTGPIYYMLIVGAIFVWTCTIFLLYDRLVERRQRKVMKAAKRSDHIVSQLFPNGFRDALYESSAEQSKAFHKSGGGDNNSTGSNPRKAQESAPVSGKRAAKETFHADVLESFKQSVGVDHHGETNQPMARLYPNCTVFFADIAGFTAWSSSRSPVQVFELLETLYGAFDKIARRRRVFKIETIGDCYVAVTGLPQPQPNHVLLMVKFARDILEKLPPILKRLAITLGPETKNLAMRVGLHSGPVTAGVLRGEKARFQLFGDTVNTAARMESNGKRECIHCSQETADILYSAGKGHWVHPRDERIVAKGKGELQTYWILPSSGESSMFDQSAIFDFEEEEEDETSDKVNKETAALEEALKGFSGTDEEKEAKLKWAQKNESSVGWIVDLLFAEVKGIAWERRQLTEYDVDVDHWGKNSPVGKNVKWGQKLQKAIFELADSTGQRGTKAWQVPKEKVKEELKLFVLLLAFEYKQDAPFHNLDHACQVLMAVEKMLKQFAIILQKGGQRQMNAWVRFTLYLAALIGDITGLQGVCPEDIMGKETPAEKRHKEFQKSLKTIWALIMDKRLSGLRLAICVNQQEQEYFAQLLVNLVYATDIAEGSNALERELRWEAAFSLQDASTVIIRLQAPSTLEHISLAAQWTHTMQLWETYKKWNSLLFQHRCDEFESEILSSDPALEWFQQELVMFERVVIPLLEKLQEPTSLGATGSELLKYASQNRRSWSRLFLSRT